jgi:hypothetical protein
MPTQSPSLELSSTASLAMYSSIATSSNPNPTVPFGNTALQTNSVAYFKEYATSKALTLVFSYANNKCPNKKKQLTIGSVATIILKRMNRIALASPLAETESCTMATKSTPTTTLVTAKLLINSTISTPKAKFYGMDLSNFYLMTPMKEYEYMQIQLELIPDKIIHQCNLRDLVDDQGWVYFEI